MLNATPRSIRLPSMPACGFGWKAWASPSKVADARVYAAAQDVAAQTGLPLPILGKQTLRDGKTGQPTISRLRSA